MDNRVSIRLTTEQYIEGQQEVAQAKYKGRIGRGDDGILLQYVHSDDMGNTRNRLEMKKGECILETKGAMDRRMIFRPGQRTKTKMQFAMGTMEFDVVTRCYQMEEQTEGRLCLHLTYDLYSGGVLVTENELKLETEPVSQ